MKISFDATGIFCRDDIRARIEAMEEMAGKFCMGAMAGV